MKNSILTVPMKNKQSQLADFVRAVLEQKGLTYNDVSQRATRAGFRISKAHVVKILNANVVPTIGKLEALAAGLGVDPVDLFKAAIGREVEPSDLDEFKNVVVKIERMSGLQREVYKEYISMLNDRLDRLASN